ncbi:MAG: nitrous oxide reductase family maturation protein NosD [Burkholderiales bacterium]|nr:nitrous oxide reductase family maturation protein NosD [Burkholderiales bacterium]
MKSLKSLLFMPLAFCLAATCFAKQIDVFPKDNLQEKIDSASSGDTVFLNPGYYRGNFKIDKSLTLKGKDATIDSEGEGTSITVSGHDISISNLSITEYGGDLYERNSGILILPGSKDIAIDSIEFDGPWFGVRADNSSNIKVSNSTITGRKNTHVLDRGDGIYLQYSTDSQFHGNKFRYNRDGIYLENSQRTNSTNNNFGGVQYGIHYMYTRDHKASGNYAAGVIGGYAIMDSEGVELKNNTAERAVEFGILLNASKNNTVVGNTVHSVHNKKGRPELDNEGKALFIFGSGANTVADNLFSDSDIGVGVSLGGEGTVLYGNSFLDNKLQARYVGTGSVEWSKDKKGNYWSNYQGWDINQDGIGDVPFQPNDSLDRLFWFYPETRFLMSSPVIALMRFLSSQFEIDKGKGITDSYPLIANPFKSPTEPA